VPKGVVSVVPGKGSVIGDAIVKHPLVKKVSFTGGTTTGRALAKLATEKLMPVTLELGGKSPTIVFDDADVEHAVNGVLFGIFSSSGESCIAGSRLFVQDSIRAQFLDRLARKAQTLRVGDPEDPRTQMGPLITAKHRESIERYVRLGLDEGGKVVVGGERPKGGLYDRGWFYKPTVLDGLSNGARICQEEIFGPVLVVLSFRDESDLIEQANQSVYGLPPESGPATTNAHGAWRVLSRRARFGSTRTSSFRSRRRSAESRRAASGPRRAGSASCSTSIRRVCTGG